MPRRSNAPRSRTRVDLERSVAEGVAYSVMAGASEAYVPAFALASGLGALSTGLVATLPMVAGATAQLATPFGVRALRSNRRWSAACALVQAGSMGLLSALAWRGDVTHAALFAVMTLYWASGMAVSPAWNTGSSPSPSLLVANSSSEVLSRVRVPLPS